MCTSGEICVRQPEQRVDVEKQCCIIIQIEHSDQKDCDLAYTYLFFFYHDNLCEFLSLHHL